jgi:hypothetical protein
MSSSGTPSCAPQRGLYAAWPDGILIDDPVVAIEGGDRAGHLVEHFGFGLMSSPCAHLDEWLESHPDLCRQISDTGRAQMGSPS